MIPVQTKVRNKSTDWDLTSSLTGTVKRRPASQESCKSISPTSKIDSHPKFPIDNNVADGNNDNAKNSECKINKQQSIEGTSSERNISSPQEIAQGNCLSHNEGNDGSSINITNSSKKINNPPQKKRSFFDLRHTAESASNKISAISSPSFASKLKLPKNISLSHLSPRRSAASRKLAQLEKQNNLFIRDGQQQQHQQQPPNSTDKIAEVEQKTNKQNSLIFGNNKAKQQQQPINPQNVSIENMEAFNLKQQQQHQLPTPPTSSSSMATKSETVAVVKNKKSSLIPAFLSGGSGSNSTKSNNNNIKIQSTSAAIKKAQSQSQGQGHSSTVSQKLSKTGIKFKELYRDFPSDSKLESKKRHPPPYREPPSLSTIQNKQVPLLPPSNNSNKVNVSEKKIRFTENALRNYEEIDDIVMGEDDDDFIDVENVIKKGNKTNIPEVSNDNGTVAASNNDDISMHMENIEQNEDFDIDGNLMAKPEYSSNVFKNIPVRARKGAVPHMENYCLFDPMDFTNEKDFKKKTFPPPRALMSDVIPSTTTSVTTGTKSRNFQLNIDTEENIEDVIFEDQLVYDISEQDERTMHLVAHHNYYEIDPELLEEDEMAAANACQLIDHNRIEQDLNVKQTVGVGDKKSKIYCNTSSTSSSSNSTSQTSTKSSTSTTSSSSDYPSLFNSVIETTHSSTMESTDENDSNGYGKVKKPMIDTINQINVGTVSNESVITISNTVTCGDNEMTNATGATKKKSPQLDRIIRQTSLTKTSTRALPQQQQNANNSHASNKPSLASKATKSTKTNLPFYNKTLLLDSLKSSHSLPQLQNITVNNRCRQQKLNKTDFNFVIDNTTTIQLRKQYYVRQGRPQSSHSDADSGFLSPVTPPDSHLQTVPINNLNVPTNNGFKEQTTQPAAAKSESTLLNQCDNIQQLIEVSFISVIIIIGIMESLSQ